MRAVCQEQNINILSRPEMWFYFPVTVMYFFSVNIMGNIKSGGCAF
jgi:hypothetical protein